ncbi:piggyBac transposable element-derived protein 2 [Nephila pilipes]|uniref:PiggyBac transposable element-derived protein 2 n=1 Tax=Nephila pilipes TaxID=299642 RepID=A0A8X6U492_NEPPI|nr:piggyBac transposable element-derived protein 2 [Nephila pilipes]
MGGVDLLDSLMIRYKINIRSRNRYLRNFYCLLDLTVVNAWLLHKRVLNANGHRSEILPQSKFRAELARSLCMVGSKYILNRGRPSSIVKKKFGIESIEVHCSTYHLKMFDCTKQDMFLYMQTKG